MKFLRTVALAMLGVMAVAACLAAAAQAAGDSGAQAYYNQLMRTLAGIEVDLPAITDVAQEAARLYVQEDYRIGTIGDQALTAEIRSRSGGMLRMEGTTQLEEPNWKGIVLYGVREGKLAEDLQLVEKLRGQGCKIIAIGRRNFVRELEGKAVPPQKFDWIINNHASEHGGVLPTYRGWLVGSDQIANVIAAWVWTGEFASACTRLGKMPPMYQGHLFGGRPRTQRIGEARFHEAAPQAVPAGLVGREYLRVLRGNLRTLWEKEIDGIRTAARQATTSHRDGHGVWLVAGGHAMQYQQSGDFDPGYFQMLHKPWESLIEQPVAAGDFVLCIGYISLPRGTLASGTNFIENARAAGVTLAFSIGGGRLEKELQAVRNSEVFIDQHWAWGDADVAIPGYDVKILPTSGVLAQAVYLLVTSEMVQLLEQ